MTNQDNSAIDCVIRGDLVGFRERVSRRLCVLGGQKLAEQFKIVAGKMFDGAPAPGQAPSPTTQNGKDA